MNKHHASFQTIAFRDPGGIGVLSAATIADLLGSAGDLAFVLDADGVIRDVAVTAEDIARIGVADWIGRRWIDTVGIDSRPKVEEIMASVAAGQSGHWRQLNHPTDSGDVPVRYLAVPLSGKRLVVIGRDLRSLAALQQRLLQAQQSLERDYLKMRQAEARYRMLFDLATEPVIIVDGATRKIREANPAAHRVLGAKPGTLADQPASVIAAPAHREALIAHLGAAQAADDVAPISISLVNGDADVRLSARLFRQSRESLLLVRVLEPDVPDPRHVHDAALSDVIEQMPDAFVLADRDLNILTANRAFADLAELPSIERLRGEALGNWLGRPGIDLDLMLGQLREHGVVRNVSAILRGAAGGQEEIEVSAVIAPSAEGDCYGFAIRNVGRRLRPPPVAVQGDMPRSVEQLTELVGRMSLKEIVRESTDLIERLCIEAALTFTSDNRASAAEILGLSRQSLYSKMHRHGLGNLIGGEG